MAIKLDKKDSMILYYLSEDARMSKTQLAKKVGLSKASVSYRIQRLKKLGIIKRFRAKVNFGAIGYTPIIMMLKFNVDVYQQQDIPEYFCNLLHTDWVASLSGDWDLLVEFVVEDFDHFHQIIEEITGHFKDRLEHYYLFFSRNNLKTEHLVKDFYSSLPLDPVKKKPRPSQKFFIDSTDKKILQVLNKDASMSLVAAANELGISIDVVKYRTKQLIEKGIIEKFFALLSYDKLGYTEYFFVLDLKNILGKYEKLQSLQNFIKSHDRTTYGFFDTVEFTLAFICQFKSLEEVDQFLRELKIKYGELIRSQEHMIIRHVHFDHFPKGLSE